MAGRPRLPDDVAAATGRAIINPGRFAGRKPPKVDPVGKPPAELGPDEAKAWRDFCKEIPWLSSADRFLLIGASQLRARIMQGDAPIAAYTEMRLILSQMGATPASRTKITAPDDKDDSDPADEFVN